jgi:hypothetical protein
MLQLHVTSSKARLQGTATRQKIFIQYKLK